jgi:biopolymer transport protein ExbD
MFATATTFIEFDRIQSRRLRDLNLTPLIDVLFILIIFFMLTTSFMRIESLELILPSTAGATAEDENTVHLFIYANGGMAIGKRRIDQSELTESLARMLEKDSRTKIMMLTADGVTTQQLVNIMDRVSLAGGRSLFVRKWENAPEEAKKPAPLPPEPAAAPEPPRQPGRADIRDLYGNF